jgi:hypothetical protein
MPEEEDGKSDLDPSVEEKKTRYDEEKRLKENTSSVEISDESYSSGEKSSSSSSSDDDSDHLSIA